MFKEKHSFDCVCEDCVLKRDRFNLVRYLIGFSVMFGGFFYLGWWLFGSSQNKKKRDIQKDLAKERK